MNIQESSSTKQFETAVQDEMQKQVKHFESEISKISTGRANPRAIEDVKVSVYGSIMALKDTASVTAPDANLLVVQPWDKSIIPDIEKSLTIANLGMTISNDGNIIRLVVPPMSAARREELVKAVGQKQEAAKVAVRNIRKDVQNDIRTAEKGKTVSEDFAKRIQDLLQKITDKFISTIDSIADKKNIEIKA